MQSQIPCRYHVSSLIHGINEVDTMYNPELWPEGTFVRRFYEPRKGTVGANATAFGEMRMPAAQGSKDQ